MAAELQQDQPGDPAAAHVTTGLEPPANAARFTRIVDDNFRLITGVAHSLKEALGNASQYIDMIEMDAELTSRQHDYSVRSRRSIAAAIRVIGEMLELARAETGRWPLQLEPVSVGAVLRDIAADYRRAAAAARGPEVEIDVPERLPAIVTDIDGVRQILDTLLSNALRCTPPQRRVRVSSTVRRGRRDGDPQRWLCLRVTDGGPGIAAPELLFEELHRAAQVGRQAGFRLVISRRVARLLGGDLTVVSRADRGTRFTLWLPVPAPPDYCATERPQTD